MKTLLVLTLNSLMLTNAQAADTPAQEQLEPDIVITQKDESQIKEYRVNGQIYMIEIIPRKGKPYYLVDADGDGQFETRRNELAPNLWVPSWVLLRW